MSVSSRITLSLLAAAAWTAGGARAQGPNELPLGEASAGFVSLFDGTVEGFRANFADYRMGDPENVDLSAAWDVLFPEASVFNNASTWDIRTQKKYQDFDFRFEYRTAGDAGVFYRFTVDGQYPWETGIEYSILDQPGLCKVCPGAAFDIFAPETDPYQPYSTLAWNQVRIVVVGDSVEHWMNGVKLVGYKYHSPSFWAAFDESKWSADNRLTMASPGMRDGGLIGEGYIGFQATHASWEIRRIRINATGARLGPDNLWATSARPRAAAAKMKPRAYWRFGQGAVRLLGMGRTATLDGRVQKSGIQPQ